MHDDDADAAGDGPLDAALDTALDPALDTALARLTTMRAPETLLPRVMAVSRRLAARPWYARPWDTWPIVHQRMAVAVCLLVLAAMTLTMPLADGRWLEAIAERTNGRFDTWLQAIHDMARIARGAEAVTNTAGSLWQGLSVPLLLYASVVGALLCLVMGLFGVALNRLTPGKAFSR
jgi:hypothetical protein